MSTTASIIQQLAGVLARTVEASGVVRVDRVRGGIAAAAERKRADGAAQRGCGKGGVLACWRSGVPRQP